MSREEDTVMPEFLLPYLKYIDPVPFAAGLTFLLLGWILYWASVNMLGALLVAGLGLVVAELAMLAVPDLAPVAVMAVRVLAFALGAVAGILIAQLVHRLAFFALGFLLGAVGFFRGVFVFGEYLGQENDLLLAFGTPVAGLVLGVLAVAWDRWLSIIATSLLGALLLTSGLHDWRAHLVLPIATAAGIVIQGMICHRRRRE